MLFVVRSFVGNKKSHNKSKNICTRKSTVSKQKRFFKDTRFRFEIFRILCWFWIQHSPGFYRSISVLLSLNLYHSQVNFPIYKSEFQWTGVFLSHRFYSSSWLLFFLTLFDIWGAYAPSDEIGQSKLFVLSGRPGLLGPSKQFSWKMPFPWSGEKLCQFSRIQVPYSDKFSRNFAQDLNLRQIARKLVPNFFTFAYKKNQRSFFAKPTPCFSFVLPYIMFLKSQNLKVRAKYARKFLIFAQSKCANICPRKNFFE